MTPLDLTQAAPQSPREELRGLYMLPRMIDIARAKLRGGQLGEYEIGRGMSALVLAEFRISVPEFVELVRQATSNEDIAQRLWQRADAGTETLSARLRRVTVADVPSELRAEFQRLYGADLPCDRSVFDVLEADDASTFARTKD